MRQAGKGLTAGAGGASLFAAVGLAALVVGAGYIVASKGRRGQSGARGQRSQSRSVGVGPSPRMAPSPAVAPSLRSALVGMSDESFQEAKTRWDSFRGGRIVWDHRVGRKVTFTFDDGPAHRTTPLLLENLARYHVPATFFVVGRRIGGFSPIAERNREILREEVRQGHLVGSHSYTHPMLALLDPRHQDQEILGTERAIERVVGLRTYLFRPPYGGMTRHVSRLLAHRGYAVVMWNLATGDPFGRSVSKVVNTAMKKLRKHQGGIFLMHDTFGWSAAALPLIVRAILLESCVLIGRGERPYLVVGLEHFVVPPGRSGPRLTARARRQQEYWVALTDRVCAQVAHRDRRSRP